MNKTELSRRKFLSRTALTLPVAAAAIPAAMELTSPMTANAAAYPSVRQEIPNRSLTSRTIDPNYTYPVANLNLSRDEDTDCSQTIQDAIDYTSGRGGGTVLIPWQMTGGDVNHHLPDGTTTTKRCIYKLNCQRDDDGDAHWAIKLKSNVRLECEAGVILQAKTINEVVDQNHPAVKRAYMIFCAGIHQAAIVNCWLVGERFTHVNSGLGTNKTDEWIYGINIAGCTGVTVLGSYISDQNGDGIQVGRYDGSDSTDVIICNTVCTGNRRQAISLTGCSNVRLYDSEFSYTYGTLPMDGIDIEPQGSSAVSDLTIDNCSIRGNAANGIEYNAQGTNISNVNVVNCIIENNEWNGISAHTGNSGSITGGSIYGTAFYQNGRYGLSLWDGVTGCTIGAQATDGTGNYTNSFANNNTAANGIKYPNTNKTTQTGFVSGSDMNTNTPSVNTWRTNNFYTH